MAEIGAIVMSADNIFVTTYHLWQYGWNLFGWWLVVALALQFIVGVYLYERYATGTRWN